MGDKIKKVRNLRHNESAIKEEIDEMKQIVSDLYVEKYADFEEYRIETDARIAELETKYEELKSRVETELNITI